MTAQSAVTILTEVIAGHEPALQALLESAGQNAADNALVPFGRLPMVHFARFFLMPAASDLNGRPLAPRVVLLADVDGPPRAFLRALIAVASQGLDNIYGHCVGYSGASQLLPYLEAHAIEAAATYVNTRGRTVTQVRQEAALHTALADYLDRHATEVRATDARRVRAALQDFVAHDDSLAWAREPAAPPRPREAVGEIAHAVLTAIALLTLLPVIVAGVPAWLVALRHHEATDDPHDVWPDDAWIDVVASQEEHGVHNPFTSAGYLKPGGFRRFTATVVLWGTSFLARHVFNHANLIGVKTIHFARWIFIDDKRRVIFASNYDGSLENYMDDFIDKIAWGLNATFSNGVDYPRTNWLLLDGAHDEQVFKRFNLMHQMVTPFWYAAYQGMTALAIDNNAQIRAGLYGDMDTAVAGAWLRRI